VKKSTYALWTTQLRGEDKKGGAEGETEEENRQTLRTGIQLKLLREGLHQEIHSLLSIHSGYLDKMSLTNTQVIHQSPGTKKMSSASGNPRFLLPAGGLDSEESGLVMLLDSKRDVARALGSTPVPAKLCGQTKAVARWALWTWTFQTQKVSDAIQRMLIRMLPVMLYASLLVSVMQAVAVVYLLTASILPLGACFLLGCIAIMCYFYVSTAARSMYPSAPRQLPHAPSSGSLTPSSSEQKLD